MKKIILFALLISAQFIRAQNKTEILEVKNDTLIYNRSGLDIEPQFPGGVEKYLEFFHTNFKMPEGEVLKDKIAVIFIIEKDGSLSKIDVLRPKNTTIANEVKRVLKKAPKWNPGQQNGKFVRVLYSLPFISINSDINIKSRKDKH